MQNNQRIGIIGCGNIGYAIAHRLSLYGFTIIMGSRYPDKKNRTQYEIVSIIECIRRSPIIFLAIHPEHYIDSLMPHFKHEPMSFNKKIIVDLSNEPCKKLDLDDFSNAERLQKAIPNAFVVKAFNTISSFAMQSPTTGESPNVFVASDYSIAKDKIIALARDINFYSFNAGSLRTARHLEKNTRSLFPEWQIPIIITLTVIIIWLTYTLCMNYVNAHTTSWNQLFLHMMNEMLCPSAITMLAIVYMPSNLACIFQLVYGTRKRRFPIWLDRWLLSRKQLGLLTFVIALCHSIMSIILMKPSYFTSWFHPVEIWISSVQNETIIVIPSSLMTAKGELACLFGIVTQLVMTILAITSIPTISNRLNWREWRLIQSKLGTVTLLLAIGHVVAMVLPYWINVGLVKSLHSLGALSIYIPFMTILLKFIFWLPCFRRPLYRIRHGQYSKEISQSNQNV